MSDLTDLVRHRGEDVARFLRQELQKAKDPGQLTHRILREGVLHHFELDPASVTKEGRNDLKALVGTVWEESPEKVRTNRSSVVRRQVTRCRQVTVLLLRTLCLWEELQPHAHMIISVAAVLHFPSSPRQEPLWPPLQMIPKVQARTKRLPRRRSLRSLRP